MTESTENTEKEIRTSVVTSNRDPVARHAPSRTPSVSHLGVAAFSLEDQVACRESHVATVLELKEKKGGRCVCR